MSFFGVYGRKTRLRQYVCSGKCRRAYPNGETRSGSCGFSTPTPRSLRMYPSCMNSPNEILSSLLTLLRANHGSLLQHGFERIVHHLRGIQIGLALGGGAARGMAHLGVLKALEQHGIYIDMLAGTSAGALTGVMYAAGLDPDYIVHCFKTDLQPPWFFRQLPAWRLLVFALQVQTKQVRFHAAAILGSSQDGATGSSDVCSLRRSRRRRTTGARGWRCDDQCPGKYQSSSPFASYHSVRPSAGGWRVAQQYSGQRAGSQGMQLCHRIELSRQS